MHTYLVAGVLAGLAPAAAAQGNKFEIYPVAVPDNSATTFTSRLSLGLDWGEVAQRIPGLLYDRVADVDCGAPSQIFGMEIRTQDQDASTPERYFLTARFGGFGLIGRCGPFFTPFVAAGGARAWTITHICGVLNVPNTGSWHMGMQLDAAPAWPRDGQSVHCAAYYPANPERGDHPRGDAAAPVPHYSYSSIAAGAFAPPATGRVLRLGVLTDAPILNMGCIDPAWHGGTPCYGIGGSYPDVWDPAEPRLDDLAWRVRMVHAPGGTAFLYVDFARAAVCVAGIRGTLALAVPRAFGAIALDPVGNGEGMIPVPAGLRPALPGLTLHFQALVHDGAAGWALSNVASVLF